MQHKTQLLGAVLQISNGKGDLGLVRPFYKSSGVLADRVSGCYG